MNYKLLTFAGLIGAGVVIGATLDRITEPDPARSEETQPVKTSSTSTLASPFSSTVAETAADRLAQLEQTIQSLQTVVQTETQQRKQLEHKVALLEKSLKEASPHPEQKSENSLETSGTSNPHQAGKFSQSMNQNTNWFNEQALMDAGIDQAKVSYIKSVFEQAEMDKLYVRDQATREGWIGSERFNDAMKEISDRTSALRSQLNDDEYDAYLYAAGRSNRVIVESVLSNSPASNAGIQAGDVILSYDNKRIYSWTDLTGATSEGAANTTVGVTVVRDNQQLQVYIPRGPMGIRLTTDSVAP
jgi:C-terminal processing protease CtpA/Prc